MTILCCILYAIVFLYVTSAVWRAPIDERMDEREREFWEASATQSKRR